LPFGRTLIDLDSPLGRKLVYSPFCPHLAKHLDAEIAKPLMILLQVLNGNPRVVKFSYGKLNPYRPNTDLEYTPQHKQKTLHL